MGSTSLWLNCGCSVGGKASVVLALGSVLWDPKMRSILMRMTSILGHAAAAE